MGRFGVKERNLLPVDFAKRIEMAVVNTYFEKSEHMATHKSRGWITQMDYILCRRCNLKESGDCDRRVYSETGSDGRV